MTRIVVVGSGPSGAHFARKALELGHEVRMLDVGFEGSGHARPDLTWTGLKRDLDDPAAYFLGDRFEGVMQPDDGAEYYAIPPSKGYVFRDAGVPAPRTEGFAPLFSWAQGGLAQVWTGGSYPFNEDELADFPFSYSDLEPFYEDVARDIGMSGAEDDLSRFVPFHGHIDAALPLDRHAGRLLANYERQRRTLQGRYGCTVGRSRVATLTVPKGGRGACDLSGRCLWGCPHEALYVPSLTIQQLRGRAKFEYEAGRYVTHFDADENGWVRAVHWRDMATGEEHNEPVDVLVLAAGALPSTGIFLESLRRGRGEAPRLGGLMDNRQVLVPFLSPALLGQDFDPQTYQYNLLAMGLETEDPSDYVHCLVTTLKSTLIHPVALSLPLDLRTALWVTRKAHAALGLVNVNFRDRRRETSFVELEEGEMGSRLVVEYHPDSGEPLRMKQALRRLGGALRALGAIVPPGMVRTRPMGASVHYAGTLPMDTSSSAGPYTTDANCRSRAFPNLYVADGATYPFLPAKNLTFTLMANAARVATRV